MQLLAPHYIEMNEDPETIRDKIIEAVLPDVVFDGWTMTAVEAAAMRAGYDRAMVPAIFPGNLCDVLNHFSDWADRAMLNALAEVDPKDMRVRDRVRCAVLARLEILAPWKDAVKLGLSYWSVPYRAAQGGRAVWRTSDRIWDWAGDTATDYNRYTKRALLSGVISSTMLFWVGRQEDDPEAVRAFLDRRIENIMQLGRIIGKIKKTG